MNYIKLLIVILLHTMVHSSVVEYVESQTASTVSYVQRYTVQDNSKKDPVVDVLSADKEELVRIWLANTTIIRMNN